MKVETTTVYTLSEADIKTAIARFLNNQDTERDVKPEDVKLDCEGVADYEFHDFKAIVTVNNQPLK